MLKKSKNITLDAASIINDVEVEHYHATISLEKDSEPNYTSYIANKILYRENRSVCQMDRVAFEEWMYSEADALSANSEEV